MTFLGLDALADLAGPALEVAGADGVEVVVDRSFGGLTRFAGSQVHQNVWTSDLSLSVRVVAPGGRVGVVAVPGSSAAEVRSAAEEALALARLAPADPDVPPVAPPAAVAPGPTPDAATFAASPADRAAAVRALFAEVPAGLEAAGAYSTGGAERAVLSSAGQAVWAPLSRAALTTVVTGPTSSGYAEAGGRCVAEVDPGAAGRVAVSKALAAADPVDVDPGDWAVVLEPAATGALVQFLAILGFNGRAYLEGRTCTAGRLGEIVVDPRVTIVDDPTSPDTVGLPFDAEGTPTRRVALIDGGRFAEVVHDRTTGARAGTGSTGHALVPPNTYGPVPSNPLMAPGDGGSVADLVAGLERGLLVTRFHYTNVVNPMETVLTGMTRDGTYLVADGRIVGGVRNLRFTQSILGALATVDAISSETAFSSELFFGGARCPALRLPAFAFTSTTTFG